LILSGVFNSIPYFGPIIVSGGLLLVGLIQFGELAVPMLVIVKSIADHVDSRNR
jgi:predicted PurR-regulated permease PerM